MFHLIPDRFKRAYSLHIFIFVTILVTGLSVLPIFFISYILLFKSNKKLYKLITNRTCYFIWIHFTYIAQWWNGLRLKVYATPDTIANIGKENALIIMNHKYDIDWLASWVLAESFGLLGGGQSFAKKSLKYVPIIGWIWQFNGTVFLERNWPKDKIIIANSLKEFANTVDGYYNVLLLYPEGTRFTKKKLEDSNEFARTKGIPEMRHCLQPRTKGFVEVVQNLRHQVNVIYDITVGFPDSVLNSVKGINTNQPPFTMSNILSARVKEGDVSVERIFMKDLPEDEEGLGEWLHDRFRKKDELFDHYVHTGKFKGPNITLQPPLIGLIIHTLVTICVLVPLGYWLCILLWHSSWMVRSAVVFTITAIFVFIQLMMNITRADKGSTYGAKNN